MDERRGRRKIMMRTKQSMRRRCRCMSKIDEEDAYTS